MHELAVAESIVGAVNEKLGSTPVRRVLVEVGRLSGVVPDALRFCWELATTGTGLDRAELEIIRLPGRARCRACGSDFDACDFITLCECGSADVTVLGGQELRIRAVEVV